MWASAADLGICCHGLMQFCYVMCDVWSCVCGLVRCQFVKGIPSTVGACMRELNGSDQCTVNINIWHKDKHVKAVDSLACC